MNKNNINMDNKDRARRRFFAACNSAGLTEEEMHAVVESYGHESTREMTEEQLLSAADAIGAKTARNDEWKKWVRRCMAAVYAHCERWGYKKVTPDYVKSIIVTSARGLSFNKLTTEQLIKVYNTFAKKSTKKKGNNEKES